MILSKKCVTRLNLLQIAALSSGTQQAMPPEFDGKWGTEVS